MPTQEIVRAARLSALLGRGARHPHRAWFDGGGPTSWGDGTGRYADDPVATLTVHASGWSRWQGDGVPRWQWSDPFDALQQFVDAARARYRGADGAGIAAVLSYDLKHAIERLPRRLAWPDTPLLFAALYDWSVRVDHRRGGAWLEAAERNDLERRRASLSGEAPAPRLAAPSLALTPAIGKPRYLAMLERAQRYIAAGDIYQVNLAQPFDAPLTPAAAAALVAAWCERYPMPYAALVEGDGWTVVSNSPECLLQLDGDAVATFPIKGTRQPERASELPDDAKEQAEHVMIVDLERNDLGRVCATGSVHVPAFGGVHRFPGVAHLVSEVRGRLRPGVTLAALLRAVFPGGSITGAPKVRAMQIIDELEPAPRGIYTGAVGWIDCTRGATFNIAIRSATLTAGGMRAWSGGGIVADSDAEREYAESWLKVETLAQALATLERSAA
ncbi:MAG: anthranilate synthase component I family protein [Deltaproteobacteria bacterium]|nr:anthranilate synthase component I family protein [Deltaproteobacteria bacterium]